ncbi:MAG: UDP-N-acetylglucosamine--N-acetylmuramyl-(pentapeptide) pyrophosphoryl-undecaprenol N-acetylglucosamine transferase [Planctomycetes bacterium]|nr:UDP-N-acetylglucosamine--N-acetylmuramyl-(pentapeptide) pyrophosphoryl-undecaprenol N-acetylglucosamine transferase [Planctomycetota bacterium]MCB9934563.1 UDP-N-acetylglucosamine--N-acetylmuramyl-(pentapeptide) pyrophosphoryl-undecaprenol N-acetylglucosamine transferase [Planctomycetota bacterium]
MISPKIAIAGGGTGGHLAPAIALAEELVERYGKDSVHLLSGGNDLERSMLGNAGFDFTCLPVSRPRAGLRSKATTVITTAIAVPAARKALKNFRANALVCVGGYAALPGAMAASLLRLPVFSLEANAVPGKVTRTIARFARVCFAHMPLTRNLDCRVEVVGNPLRKAFLKPAARADAKRALGLDSRLPTLLVIGGSQGAGSLNDAIISAAAELESLRGRFQVLHITGSADRERAERAWRALGIHFRVTAFTHNAAIWFAATDVALTRSGAGTISELLAMGVPLLMVPYPHAADDHQRSNALWVASANAGVVLPEAELSPARLRELLDVYLLGDLARSRASEAALHLATPDATCVILDRILDEIGLSAAPSDADSEARAAA